MREKRTCKNCGCYVPDDVTFCVACGFNNDEPELRWFLTIGGGGGNGGAGGTGKMIIYYGGDDNG